MLLRSPHVSSQFTLSLYFKGTGNNILGVIAHNNNNNILYALHNMHNIENGFKSDSISCLKS